jgi:hypothetical protein
MRWICHVNEGKKRDHQLHCTSKWARKAENPMFGFGQKAVSQKGSHEFHTLLAVIVCIYTQIRKRV